MGITRRDAGLAKLLAPSYRALFIGILGCLAVGAGSQYTDMMLKRSGLTGWFYTPGAIILLFVLSLLINPLMGLLRRKWILRPAEMAQVYVMWIVGSAVSTCGFVSYFLPMLRNTGAIWPWCCSCWRASTLSGGPSTRSVFPSASPCTKCS